MQILEQDMGFAIEKNGSLVLTPGKNPLCVPTRALAEALAAELEAKPKKIELASLAYTAIDRIAPNPAPMIEALLVYVDTDALSYRAAGKEELAKRQLAQWDPVLAHIAKTYGVTWEVTEGIMPIDQPEALHRALSARFSNLSAFELAAAGLLASHYSSLALTLAVLDGHLSAEAAFECSRLEEKYQEEKWGFDAEAAARTARIHADVVAVKRFLDLLAAA